LGVCETSRLAIPRVCLFHCWRDPWSTRSTNRFSARQPEKSKPENIAAGTTAPVSLDEIGDIPLALQPKLLRVLQEREFERLGSGRTHRVNVRVVTATHRDLTEMVRRNEFRRDLYYRLNVFPVVLPPLRERRQDIEPLVSHFVQVFSRRLRKRIDHVPEETLEAFASYSWPGNPSFLDKIQRAGASNPDIATNLLPQHRSQRRPTRLPERARHGFALSDSTPELLRYRLSHTAYDRPVDFDVRT
jgi:transcriptional regulator with GAF, ATPase, and Fis domain